MRYFKDDGKTHVEGGKAEEISLQSALQEIDKHPSEDDYDGNFIGFINDKNQTVQFIRQEEESWLIDVPIIENSKSPYSLNDTGLITEKVKDIVTKFYADENWMSLCNLKK